MCSLNKKDNEIINAGFRINIHKLIMKMDINMEMDMKMIMNMAMAMAVF